MQMPRPQRAQEAESHPDDGWIWGSSRGGGGAPLKTKDGSVVTNLKLVINGDVEPDHSPTGSPNRSFGSGSKNTGRRYDDDDRDHYGGGGGRGGGRGGGGGRRDSYDPYDDDRDDYRGGGGGERWASGRRDPNIESGGGRGGGYGSGRKIAFRDEEDEEHYGGGGRSSNRGGGGRGGGGRGGGYGDSGSSGFNSNNNDGRRAERDRVRSPVNTNIGGQFIPGLDNHHSSSGGGSPSNKRGFMGSIKAMHSSENPDEQHAKLTKEMSYQNELRMQIEVKKHAKDLEEHKDKTLKQKELEEYLAVHYKGKVRSQRGSPLCAMCHVCHVPYSNALPSPHRIGCRSPPMSPKRCGTRKKTCRKPNTSWTTASER